MIHHPTAMSHRMDLHDYVSNYVHQRGFTLNPQDVENTARQMQVEWLHQCQYAVMMGAPSPELDSEDSQTPEDYFSSAAVQEIQLQWAIQDIIDRSVVAVSPQELQQEALAIAKRQSIRIEDVMALLGENLHLLKQDLLERKAMAWMETQLITPISQL